MKKQKVNGNFVSFEEIRKRLLGLEYNNAIRYWNECNFMFCNVPSWQAFSISVLSEIEQKQAQQDAEFRESLLNNQKTTHIHPQPGSTVNMNCHQQNTNLAIDPQNYTPEQINYLLNHSKL